jgi:outer membrane protein assembly factor BamB
MNSFQKFFALLLTSLFCPLPWSSPIADPGTKIWEFATPQPISASPALSPDGVIYIASYDRNIYALDSGGTLRWTANLPLPIYIHSSTYTGVFGTPAIGADGTLYVPSENGKLLALDPSNGSVKWTYSTTAVEGMYSSPAIGPDGTIYVGSYDRNLYAIDANGTRKWSSRFDSTIFASPAIGPDGTIYCGADNGQLYALNPLNGNKRWTFNTGSYAITASPAIAADGTLYLGVGSIHNPKFYSISPQGNTNWVFTTGSRVRSSAALGPDGTIYFGCDDGNLYALDPNGAQKWAFAAGTSIGSSPAIAADGTIYFGSDNGKLYALDSAGNELWTFQTQKRVFTSPAIGPDGTVYIASADGKLYVVQGSSPPALSDWPMFRHNAARTGRATAPMANNPPVLAPISHQTITAGETLTLTASATDPDAGQQLAFSLGLGAPDGARIDVLTGLFEWKPSDVQTGVHLITVVVTDNGSPQLSDTRSFSVTVEPTGGPHNEPPQIDPVPDQVLDELSPFTLRITATDATASPQTLAFSLLSPPPGAAIDSVTGVFTWTPKEEQGPGFYTITVVVSDDGVPSLSDTRSFQIEVREVNSSPVIDPVPNYTIHPGALLTFALSATDADIPANTLTYRLGNAPAGASVDGATGVFTWHPTEDQAGARLITAIVTDSGAPPLSASADFAVTVLPLAIRSITRKANEVEIIWSSIAGARYRIEYKSNLSEVEWLSLPGDVVASDQTAAITDIAGAGPCYYRVLFLPEE